MLVYIDRHQYGIFACGIRPVRFQAQMVVAAKLLQDEFRRVRDRGSGTSKFQPWFIASLETGGMSKHRFIITTATQTIGTSWATSRHLHLL